jgi:glycosyltransferase involved in cell wall biosynthesis
MKFVLAAPLYPPDIGGPSFYAERLTHALRALGHEVVVANFGAYKHLPTGVRHGAYFFALKKAAKDGQVMITLDTFSAAVPAAVLSRMRGIPLVARIGGDFLWEQYVNRTHADLPLPDFYKKAPALSFKDKVVRSLTRFVLTSAIPVFSSRFQYDIWKAPYGIGGTPLIIENAVSERVEPVAFTKKNFVCFSRDIPLKNLARLSVAFENARTKDPTLSLEVGHVTQAELVERVRSCYAVIVPSLSEITPNFVLDAIRCGKPFIQTKYSAYAETFKDYGLSVDPLSQDDIEKKVLELADPAVYDRLMAHARAHPFTRSYDDIAAEFVTLAQSLKQ